jgi:hypothetical protein
MAAAVRDVLLWSSCPGEAVELFGGNVGTQPSSVPPTQAATVMDS